MRRPTLALTAPLVALTLGLAACAGDGDGATPTTAVTAAAPVPAAGGSTDVAAAPVADVRSAGFPAQTPTPDTTAPLAAARQVRVSATGSVTAAPDTLTINIGVRTQAETANGALSQAATSANAVIDTLKDAGVAEDDLRTVDISVWPRYDNQGSSVVGYEATNTVLAKVRDLSRAGAVIDAAAAAAGDSITISGLTFSIEDPTTVYAQAREQAVKRAREQAEQLAAAAGVQVGQVVSIDEQAQYVPSPMPYAGGAAAAGAADTTPVQPGQTTVTLTVGVVYELVG